MLSSAANMAYPVVRNASMEVTTIRDGADTSIIQCLATP
jgi:hypothetical protein